MTCPEYLLDTATHVALEFTSQKWGEQGIGQAQQIRSSYALSYTSNHKETMTFMATQSTSSYSFVSLLCPTIKSYYYNRTYIPIVTYLFYHWTNSWYKSSRHQHMLIGVKWSHGSLLCQCWPWQDKTAWAMEIRWNIMISSCVSTPNCQPTHHTHGLPWLFLSSSQQPPMRIGESSSSSYTAIYQEAEGSNH